MVGFLLKVDDNAPSKVLVVMFHLDQSTGLEERDAIERLCDVSLHLLLQLLKLLSYSVVVGHFLLVLDNDGISLFFQFLDSCVGERGLLASIRRERGMERSTW